jgi:hypothetical protein
MHLPTAEKWNPNAFLSYWQIYIVQALVACTQWRAILLVHVATLAAEAASRPLTSESHIENSVPLLAIAGISSATCQLSNIALNLAWNRISCQLLCCRIK